VKLIEKAIGLALKYHEGQTYDNGTATGEPYIMHPLRVLADLDVGSENEIAQCAAVLHDVMEDCGVTRDDLLSEGIPLEAIEIIELLTRQKDTESYMDYIKRVNTHEFARSIKLSDLRTNMDYLFRLPSEQADRLRKRYREALDYLMARWNEEIDALYRDQGQS